jgi:hypothetical protein
MFNLCLYILYDECLSYLPFAGFRLCHHVGGIDVQDWGRLRWHEYRGLAWRFLIFLLLLESSCRLWFGLWSGVYFLLVSVGLCWGPGVYLMYFEIEICCWNLGIFCDVFIILLWKFLWKLNYVWFCVSWMLNTLNLVFICWFIIKYRMWGLSVLHED